MAKMIFPYQVKYENKYFLANMPFDVQDEDIKNLISEGGKVIGKKPDKSQDKTKSTRRRGASHDTA